MIDASAVSVHQNGACVAHKIFKTSVAREKSRSLRNIQLDAQKSRRSFERRLLNSCSERVYTLTSGPRDAGPLEPPPGPLGFGLRGTARLRVPGSFSGLGVTGPSTNSKPIFCVPGSAAASPETSPTRT